MTTRLPKNIEDAYPLAPLQSGMLFHSAASPESGVYIEQLVVQLDAKDLNVELFKQAWSNLTARHPVLRTAFIWKNVKQPLQVVHKFADLVWTELDYRGIDSDRVTEAISEFQSADRLHDFDLLKAPLQRMALIRISDTHFTWIWTRHHIIADGWSTSILLRELNQLYTSITDKRPLDLPVIRPYRDYISSLATADSFAASKFWKAYLEGVEAPLLFAERVSKPEIKPGNSETAHLHHEAIESVSQHETELLRSTCRSSRVTLNTAVQAAWCLLLERYAGQADITWGSIFSGRSDNLKGAEQIVGLMINTVPLRQRVDPSQSVQEFLRVVQSNLLSVMEYEQSALADIQSLSPLGAGTPLFDTVVVFENYPRNPPEDDLIGFGKIEYHEQSNLPLALIATPREQLELILIYDTRFFSGAFCKKLLSELIRLLVAMANDEHTLVGQLPVLTDVESETLLEFSQLIPASVNKSAGPLNAELQYVDSAIRKRALEEPDAVAIRFADLSIRYGELEAISNIRACRISEELTRSGVTSNQCVVALHLPRSEDVIIWMIAVLKAGAAYLILDQSQPVNNLRHMLESSATMLLITDGMQSDLNADRGLPQLDVGSLNVDSSDDFAEAPGTEARTCSDIAYILYTSGSTGQPKGVGISHENLLASTHARLSWYSNAPDNYLLLSPLSFDSSVAGIYWTLTTGGTLVISPPRLEQNMLELAESINSHQITHTLCLPSLYRLLLESVEQVGQVQMLKTLKTIIIAGEVVQPLGLLDRHQRLLPNTLLVNEYGPTEATVWCCAAEVSGLPYDQTIPIGKPVGNNRLYVLDHLDRLAPQGAMGQLVIAGDQISPGYWRDQNLTSAAFRVLDITSTVRERVYLSGDQASWREDGSLDFMGRNDDQVKIRGHRVEITGIESSICSDSWIDEAAVIVIPGADASRSAQVRLAAFIVVSANIVNDTDLASVIQDRLSQTLSQYMVPAVIEIRDSLPRLSNDKIDRHSLVVSENQTSQAVGLRQAPETDREIQIHKIWQELLGLDLIGIDDNFFALGGDSIMSIRLLSALSSIGFKLDPNAVFETPTIRELSARIQCARQRDIVRAPPLGAAGLAALYKEFGNNAEYLSDLSESQSAYLFSWMRTNHMDPGHVQIQATVTGQFSDSQFKKALENIVNRHEALRTAIHWRNRDAPIQVIYREIDIAWSQAHVSVEDSQVTVDQYLVEDRANRLELDKPQVWRIQVFRISHSRSIVCWSFHHSLVDGWSAAIVVRSMVEEMRRLTLSEESDRSEVPSKRSNPLSSGDMVRYRDYLYWLDRQNLGTEESKWKNYVARLGVESGGLPLPESVQKSATHSVTIDIQDTDWGLLHESISRQGTTISRLIHSCWGLVLSIASKNRCIGFSTTVSGRNIPVEGSEEIVGQLVNHLPVFFESSVEPKLEQTLVKLNAAFTLISGIEHIPASQLMSWSGNRGHTNSCVIDGFEIPSLIMMENFPWSDSSTVSDAEIRLSSFQRRGDASSFSESGSASVFPVTLVAVPEPDGLQLQLHYKESLFERSAASALLQEIHAVILRWCQDSTSDTDAVFHTTIRNFFSVITEKVSVENLQTGRGRAPESELEKSLTAIWGQLFDQKFDNVQLNYFNLGGTSLQAVSMMELIRKHLHMRIPLSLLIEHPTIESLATAISEGKHKTAELLVTVQPNGICNPIFGIHAEGNVLFYKSLADILGKEQPFFGVQTPELVNVDLRFDSVKEMAAEYIQQIKKVQAEGPYSIVGMCFGGWIAYEMANQLSSIGERLNLLCVLDSDAPGLLDSASNPSIEESGRSTDDMSKFGDSPHSEPSDITSQHVKRKKFWEQTIRYHRDAPLLIKAHAHLKTGRLLKVTLNYFKSSAGALWIKKYLCRGQGKNEPLELLKRIRNNQDKLIREYDPASSEIDTVFIFSDEFSRRTDWNRQIRNWKSLCHGKFEYHVVSGNHLEILKQPHVEKVAAIINGRVPVNKIDEN